VVTAVVLLLRQRRLARWRPVKAAATTARLGSLSKRTPQRQLAVLAVLPQQKKLDPEMTGAAMTVRMIDGTIDGTTVVGTAGTVGTETETTGAAVITSVPQSSAATIATANPGAKKTMEGWRSGTRCGKSARSSGSEKCAWRT